MISTTLPQNDYISKKLDEFNLHTEYKLKEQRCEKLRENFVKDFSVPKIQTMTLDEYVEGKRSKQSFCYRVENELKDLGDIHGSNCSMFGIWFGENKKDHEVRKYRVTQKYDIDGNIENSFIELKKWIIKLLADGSATPINPYFLDNNLLPLTYKSKLLAIYYPDSFLNTFSENYLKCFLSDLGIYFSKKDNAFDYQIKILNWKNSNPITRRMSNFLFNEFLYFAFGNPKDRDFKSIEYEAEDFEDHQLIAAISEENFNDAEPATYSGKPKKADKPIYSHGHKTYPRDKRVSVKALKIACFKCEIDITHKTFMRKNGGVPYTEPHHLVPISASELFPDCSLDVEENIVSLCSNCHNEIHYGANSEVLVRNLFEKRKTLLETVGIKINIEDLLKLY